ncbi:UNVERIFIED_CONTAM: hypothetical protein FKN15_036325 [Acipenser sinensis]
MLKKMVRFVGCGSSYIIWLQFQTAWLNDCQSAEYNWSPHCYFKAAEKIYGYIYIYINILCGATTYRHPQTREWSRIPRSSQSEGRGGLYPGGFASQHEGGFVEFSGRVTAEQDAGWRGRVLDLPAKDPG